MRYVLLVVVLLVLPLDRAASQATLPTACPATTDVENTAIARAWHEDVINRKNPAVLRDILAADVVHHAAGGYPKVMNAAGITAMMQDFLTAFPDLRYTFDHFIAKDNHVVERYTATGTQRGHAAVGPNRDVDRNQHLSDRVREDCRGLVGGRCRQPNAAAHRRFAATPAR
jgi:hypothetical protein